MEDASITTLPPAARPGSPWQEVLHGTLFSAMLGSVLLALSFPPIDLWPLAWVATLPWLRLIALPRLPGWRPYLSLYLAGMVHWLLVLHWLRLPHWMTAIAGVLLCAYLAVYLPLLVAISRVAVHRWRWSLPLAAPLVWMGLEFARQWFLSGFSMACLAHTQHRWLTLIQVAELGGTTLVSGVVLLPAAWLASALWHERICRRQMIGEGVIGGGVLAAVLIYGHFALRQSLQPVMTAALIQGNYDTTFDPDTDKTTPVMREYGDLTQAVGLAVRRQSDPKVFIPPELAAHVTRVEQQLSMLPQPVRQLDLLVWPESIYRYPLSSFAEDFLPPPELKMPPAEFADKVARQLQDFLWSRTVFLPRVSQGEVAPQATIGSFLIGAERVHFLKSTLEELANNKPRFERYNSAALFAGMPAPSGNSTSLDFYDKRHLVLCGEYMPLGYYFPWIYELTPVGRGLNPGIAARSLPVPVAGPVTGISPQIAPPPAASPPVRISPSICYENVLPQVIRRQMLELHAAGETPDVLVNLSNDGWFFGSSELDLHLVCGVFRAVETRRPMLIAANTGFSAAIDPLGRITAQGKRHAPDILIVRAQIFADPPRDWLSFYVRYGELAGMLGLGLCLGVVSTAIYRFWHRSQFNT
ncbi:MAG: apolipoprotein N-acyltransferase [Pirellulales bacterium]|nr:apolipoprotein N-acyltransferase [Pirellulales bacterium]